METIKRRSICWVLTKQQKEWMEKNCCPICGLPKDKWKRRKDWRCCSTKCTTEFSNGVVFIWQYWKEKAKKRDNFTCVKCGFEGREEKIIHPDDKKYYDEKYKIFKILSEDESIVKVILGCSSKLIVDHIIPIALGGEEYDLNNVQTLCVKCNKIKTKEDLKKIVIYRKQSKSQTYLKTKENFI